MLKTGLKKEIMYLGRTGKLAGVIMAILIFAVLDGLMLKVTGAMMSSMTTTMQQQVEQISKDAGESEEINELTEITEIALEAGLSGHEITAEQSDKVIRLSYKTARAIFIQQNIFERFYMKFIKNLI